VKRTSTPIHLKRPPLIYVVGQVLFTEVVAIEKFVPDIQESLRHKGFPRFLRGQVQEIAFQPDGSPKFSALDRFESLGIVLQTKSVAIQTNSYSNYETFEEQIKTALMAVHRVVNISLSERIGLRYVNLVRLEIGEKWSDYLNPGLLGLDANSVGVSQWASRSELVGPTKLGNLAVRCSQSGQPIPPDLVISGSLNNPPKLAPGEIVTTLDFDHYVEKSSDFEVAAVVSTFEQLHEMLDVVFATAVTPQALLKWGKEGA
jgi:uncharacterized protein (TIGR04255 family)